MAPPRRAHVHSGTDHAPDRPDPSRLGQSGKPSRLHRLPQPQPPRVHAPGRIEQGMMSFQDVAQFGSPREHAVALPKMPPSHAGPPSPYPFPPSEHPLPPRGSTPRRPAPQLSIPQYFPSCPPPQYLPLTPPQYTDPRQFAAPQSPYPLGTFGSHFTQGAGSFDYCFPLANNAHGQLIPLASPVASAPSYSVYNLPPHQRFYSQPLPPRPGGGAGSSHAPVLTPFPPVPIRHLESAPRAGSRPLSQNDHDPALRYSAMEGRQVGQAGFVAGTGSNFPPAHFPPPGLPPPLGSFFPSTYSVTNEAPSIEFPVAPTPLRPHQIELAGPSKASSHPSSSVASARSDHAHQLPSPPASASHLTPDSIHQIAHSRAQTLSPSSQPPRPVPSPCRRPSSPTLGTYPEYPLDPHFGLPPPGGITPAIPRDFLAGPPPPMSTQMCDVEGCPFPRFCSLSPCGDMICRDHLGTVIRRVQLKPRKNLSSARATGGEQEMVKVFECVKCGKQSEMVGPTLAQQKDKLHRRSSSLTTPAHHPSKPGVYHDAMSPYPSTLNSHQQQLVQQQTAMVGLGLDLGGAENFSIHYFSHGPTGTGERGGYRAPRRLGSISTENPTDGAGREEANTAPGSPNVGITRDTIATDPTLVESSHVGMVPRISISPQVPAADSRSPFKNEADEEPRHDVDPEREPGWTDSESRSRLRLETNFAQGGESVHNVVHGQVSGEFDAKIRVEAVDPQTVEPLSPSPDACSSEKLAQFSTPPRCTQDFTPRSPPRSCVDTKLCTASCAPSSASPPATPVRQTQRLAASDSPISPDSVSASTSFSSPRHASELFPKYSYSPRGYRSRGRGGRGGRGRGYDPSYRWSPRRSRYGSLATTHEEELGWKPSPMSGERGERLYEPPIAPQFQLDNYVSKVVDPELRSRFYVIKLENIPFSTTYREIENWLPPRVLPLPHECPQPIHIILHRVTGRTLPHCYIELRDADSALLLMSEYDRTMLGTRTVRVKMERVGEFMRDVFDQTKYFAWSPVPRNLSQDPLPSFPANGYRLPETILSEPDLAGLERSIASTPWSPYAPRIPERVYNNLGTILSKFPWERRAELWNDDLRDRLFHLVGRAISISRAAKGPYESEYSAIADRLSEIVVNCPGFTRAQRDKFTLFRSDEFPPLSSPVELSKDPSTDSSAHIVSNPQVASPSAPRHLLPPLAIGGVDSHRKNATNPAVAWTGSELASGRAIAPSPVTTTPSHEVEARVTYWAETPGQPSPNAGDADRRASSISSSAWIDFTPQRAPATLDSVLPRHRVVAPPPPASSSVQSWSPELPSTPPESPETARPRSASEWYGRRGGGGGGGRGRGRYRDWKG